MKATKKNLALIMVTMLILSVSVTAFAENAHIITITNASAAKHTYSAYQVFTGKYVADDGSLVDITWGTGVDYANLLADLQASTILVHEETPEGTDTPVTVNDFAGCTTAEDVAAVLATYEDDSAKAQAFAVVVGANLSSAVAGTSTATEAGTGFTYSISVAGDGYYFIKDSEVYYDGTDTYSKTTTTVYECSPKSFSFTGTTAADGTLTVTGLNVGTYTITELISPDGYNLLDEPISNTISCDLPEAIITGEEACDWNYTMGTEQTNGTVQVTIENNKGAVLPSAGGIGTTIFYAVGGIMVLAAAVLLITKKRIGD